METIIITVLITLGSVILISGLITLGIVAYKLSKSKLSCDEANKKEELIYDEIRKNHEELAQRIGNEIRDVQEQSDKDYAQLTSLINSRCDKLHTIITK